MSKQRISDLSPRELLMAVIVGWLLATMGLGFTVFVIRSMWLLGGSI